MRTTRRPGSNGTYVYSSVASYQALQPTQYSAAAINNPLVRALVLDGSAFFQDDWRVKPNLMLGLGIRYEDQNWIHNHNNWAPRLALAWSPGRPSSSPAKTVIRAGYGWFYDRFTVPSAFSSFGGAPFIVQVLHDNRINQQTAVTTNPSGPASLDGPLVPQHGSALQDCSRHAGWSWNRSAALEQGHGEYYLSLHAGRASVSIEQRDRARV